MNILAIETTGAEASVAIINERDELVLEYSSQRMNHLQNLMALTDLVLKKSKMSINDISHVAVSEGPGSFTGIRIGVSSARALSQALGIPVVGVPTLQSFLYDNQEEQGIICPIFDARRSQVYGGAYRWQSEANGTKAVTEIVTADAYELEEYLRKLEDSISKTEENRLVFFGDGADSYKELLLDWVNKEEKMFVKLVFAPEEKQFQKASAIAKMGKTIILSGKESHYLDIKPVYLRKAEAERKLEEKS